MSIPTADLVFWYRQGVGITSAGGLVSQWDDQSGNDNHLVQATGTNQPSHEADGSILCDGVDNFIKAAAFAVSQPFTIYFLGRNVTLVDGSRIVSADTNDNILIWNTSAGVDEIGIYAGTTVAQNNDFITGAYAVVSAVFNGASSSLQVNNGTPTTGNAGANNLDGLTLGANATGINPANAQFKELLGYSGAHDAATRTVVVNELNLGNTWRTYRSLRGRR